MQREREKKRRNLRPSMDSVFQSLSLREGERWTEVQREKGRELG